MEETWDETLMGPRDEDLQDSLRSSRTRDPEGQQTLMRSASTGSAPPSAAFGSMPERWAQHEPSNNEAQDANLRAAYTLRQANSFNSTGSRSRSLKFEDESGKPDTTFRSRSLRKDALRFLEDDDEIISDTKAGKRVPTALSGFSFAAARTNNKPYRDDPYADMDAPPARDPHAGRDEYRDAIDAAQVEERSAASRPVDADGKNWSSRYSIDSTMLALSGGAVSSSKMLDKMDKEHEASRQSARNLFMASPQETKAPKVFGSGFSFRQKHIFGNQGVTAKNDQNLKTVWMDTSSDKPTSSSPSSTARSWHDQFMRKRRIQRNALIAVSILVIFLVIVASMMGRNRSSPATSTSSATRSGPGGEEAITFYITSDVPLSTDREQTFVEDLHHISHAADFVVHLGNIQNAADSGCEPNGYSRVSGLLKQSPAPMFVLPGEEDWNNCDDQDAGWQAWVDNFLFFESNFEHGLDDVLHLEGQEENFAFVSKGVLFVGVHEVNGELYTKEEQRVRNKNNVDWIEASVDLYGDDIRAMVVFANGRPALRVNDNFYLGLGDFLYANKIPTAYVHADHDNGGEFTYKPYDFDGMEHVIAIQSSRGQDSAPLRINVGFDSVDPFIVG